MTVSGFQEFWVVGSRFYFQNEKVLDKALLDLGTIQVVSPTIEAEKIELEDSDGGVRKVVDEAVSKISESYDIVCHNFNVDNLALLFLANTSSPAEFTQTIDEIQNVPHTAVIGPGQFVKLTNLAGVWLYSITSIIVKSTNPATTTTAIPLVENTDWKWISKDRGVIEIISGGAISDGDTIYIDIIPVAVTGIRMVYPQTGSIIKGRAMLVWGRNNNTEQTVREAIVTISPSSANFQIEDYSEFTLQAKIVSDITEVTAPA
ncbi:unnamed protein product, partial [marine sediment metagenome]